MAHAESYFANTGKCLTVRTLLLVLVGLIQWTALSMTVVNGFLQNTFHHLDFLRILLNMNQQVARNELDQTRFFFVAACTGNLTVNGLQKLRSIRHDIADRWLSSHCALPKPAV
ncbi:hypothetical protein FHR92_005188 [Fontibacillus solani]|uniref:Uncharacterized protein n=1 Tax=Fontibacillus solani TaxID=1572857 RepID=A0A7W3XUG0_9BACL|nr:hypothetical protein [Fontibacillus solani]MBA9088670.1 hypothetical protein [Fontibacillus solani]